MSCDSLKDKLEAYVLGLLSEPETQQIRQHVQTCADCQQKVARLQNAAHLIGRGFDQAPPAYLRSKVLANLKNSRQPKYHWLAWVTPGLVGVAVLVLVIKIDPARILRQQAVVPAALEQKQTEATLEEQAEKPAAKSLQSRMPAAAKETLKKQPRAAVQAPTLPARLAKDDGEQQAATRDLASRKLADESDEARPAPAKREAPMEDLAGGAQPLSAAAPAQSSMVALEQTDRRSSNSREEEAKTRPQARELVCAVSLAGTEGRLDPMQVQAEIDGFAQQVQGSIIRQGETKTVMLRVTLDPQGKVTTVAYTSRAFDSANLNQLIVGKIRQMSFTQPMDSAAAVIIIKIEVK